MRNSLIVILILLSFTCKAQQYYFNERLHFGCDQNGFKIAAHDGYYDFIAPADCIGLGTRSVFFRLDSLGNLLFSKSFGVDYHNFFSGSYSGLNITPSRNYLYAGSVTDTTGVMNIFLYYLSSNGDSIWTRQYTDTGFQAALQCRITHDAGIISVAQVRLYNPDRNDDIMLLKTDSMGNELWRKTFGGSDYEAPYTIDTCQDGGFYIAGYTRSFGVGAFSGFGNAVIIKTDSAGDTLWTRAFGDVYDDGFTNGLTLKDGGYLAVGMTSTYDPFYPAHCCSGYKRLYMVKVDSSLQTVFEKQYGRSDVSNILFSVKELANGNIVAAGWYTDTMIQHIRGVVLETDANGDSLWMHTYENLHGHSSDSFFYDISPTSDNGFILTGSMFPGPGDTGVQDIWVLKIDSNGCEISNCLINNLAQEYINHQFSIAPNPSSGIFHVFSEGDRIKKIEIYNAIGVAIETTFNTNEIDLSKYTTGIYFGRILFDDNTRREVKLIKE